MKEFLIDKNEENKRLDKFLKTVLPKANDSFIYKMLRKKNIKLNDKKAEGNEKLLTGDVVKIYFSDETFSMFASDTVEKVSEYEKAYKTLKNINVVYEDNDLIIVNKPINVLSQKAKDDDISINEWLIGYLISNKCISIEGLNTYHPSILNRLDKNTTGLLIGAKTYKASRIVSTLIKEKKIRKFYKTTVKGILKEEMLLEGYLSKDPKTNKVKIFHKEPKDVECSYIKTKVTPLQILEDKTVCEVELFTGKTHQIRAHLASIGHPILGDPKYGDQAFNKKCNRYIQDLTAYRLEFPDECEIESLRKLVVKL